MPELDPNDIPKGVTLEYMQKLVDRDLAANGFFAKEGAGFSPPVLPPSDLGKPRIYVIGSLKNANVPVVAQVLREPGLGYHVFDSWHGAGPDADRYWREYEQARGLTYTEALDEPLARHSFAFDMQWLTWCNVGVLVLPCGKSAHLELGYLTGKPGKRTFILMEGEPEEDWDLMNKIATKVVTNLDALVEEIGGQK